MGQILEDRWDLNKQKNINVDFMETLKSPNLMLTQKLIQIYVTFYML